jgi:hypothetical protein
MSSELTPFRWPASWKDPSALALLGGTPFDCLVCEKGAAPDPVLAQARQKGLTIVDPASPQAGALIAEGEWPGVQMARGQAAASSGPTGNPWVDSNGWRIRLESARNPASRVWVDAKPKDGRALAASYPRTIADAAAYGGRWIVTLDDQLAGDIAQGKADALAAWQRIAGAARFFNDRKAWSGYAPVAVLGIVSDFSGDNEFMGQELLNLVARTNQQSGIILKDKVSASSFAGLRAVIYADGKPPAASLRRQIMAFVQSGGTLITGPNWGPAPGTPGSGQDQPGYAWRVAGKGRVAFAQEEFGDPYALANEAVLLNSHRYDSVRFWNAGSAGSYFTAAPDRKRAVVHMLFYTDRGGTSVTVRVSGNYRTGKLWTLDGPEPRPIEMDLQKDAVELHLPTVSQYAAAELEA